MSPLAIVVRLRSCQALGCQLLSNTVISLEVSESVITPCYRTVITDTFLSNPVVTVPLLRVLLVTVNVTKIQ